MGYSEPTSWKRMKQSKLICFRLFVYSKAMNNEKLCMRFRYYWYALNSCLILKQLYVRTDTLMMGIFFYNCIASSCALFILPSLTISDSPLSHVNHSMLNNNKWGHTQMYYHGSVKFSRYCFIYSTTYRAELIQINNNSYK